MSGAIIQFDQDRSPSPISHGSPGVARNDLWLSRTITCLSTAGGNISYAWTLLDVPPGSAAALAGATTATATFTPDLPGTYRVQLITNGGGPGNVQVLVAAVRFDTTGVLVNRGWRRPALGEVKAEGNYSGNTRGWDEAIGFILADLLTELSNGPGVDLLSDFTQPDEFSTVQINCITKWMVQAEGIKITGGGGFYSLVSIDDAKHATVRNLGGPRNAAHTTIIHAGAIVGPGFDSSRITPNYQVVTTGTDIVGTAGAPVILGTASMNVTASGVFRMRAMMRVLSTVLHDNQYQFIDPDTSTPIGPLFQTPTVNSAEVGGVSIATLEWYEATGLSIGSSKDFAVSVTPLNGSAVLTIKANTVSFTIEEVNFVGP